MFGIEKINLEISRLWNAVMEVDRVARCAVRDGDVLSKSNKEAHRKIGEQGEAVMAIAKHLGVTFDHELTLDPMVLPQSPPMIRVMVCKKVEPTKAEKGGG